MEAVVGVDFPIMDVSGPVRPSASVGVGVRHHRIEWDEWGEPLDSFSLPTGSHGETDVLAKVGLELAVPFGSWEVLARGSVDFSRFGPGVDSTGWEDWPASSPAVEVDYGRVSDNVYALVIGVRWAG
jgi:hypothetical protein